jgi:APA family basic amino acid/polyamine antiporter
VSEEFVARRGRLPGDVRVVVTRRRVRLPRLLGPGALFSACYGNVGSSIYYGLGVTAGFALGLTPLAMILAGGIFVSTALAYAEGTAAIPYAGGSSSFARRAFNESIGYLVGWVQLLNYTATVAISAYFAIGYLSIFGHYVALLSALEQPGWHALAAILLTGFLVLLNIVGIQESSLVNLILAFLDLGTQVLLVVLGLWLLLNLETVIHNVHLGVAPTWGRFLASISIAMVTYTGIETISNMSEEAKNPGRSVPLATFAVIGAVLFVSAFLPTIAMSVFPVHPDGHGGFTTELATTWKGDPVAGVVSFFRPEALAFWMGVWVAVLAFTILVIATNAGLIGISRLSYSLAVNDLFPRVFSRLHPRFQTPYVSIVVFGLAACLLMASSQIDLMAATYSLAATFAFAVAHLAVVRLRFVEPYLRRPFRMPINVPLGRGSLPVLSMIGVLAIGAVFAQLFFENIDNSSFVYVGWLSAGVLTFVLYRCYRRKPLWHSLAAVPPVPHLVPTEPRRDRYAVRVRMGRRRLKEAALPVSPAPSRTLLAQVMALRNPRRAVWGLALAGYLAMAVLAVWFDLSPYDPFGPRLGWSPGLILISILALVFALRGRRA